MTKKEFLSVSESGDQKNKWELYSWDFGGIRTLFLDEPYVRMFFFTFCMAMLWYTEQPQFETVTTCLFGARFLALRRPRFVLLCGRTAWDEMVCGTWFSSFILPRWDVPAWTITRFVHFHTYSYPFVLFAWAYPWKCRLGTQVPWIVKSVTGSYWPADCFWRSQHPELRWI